MSIIRLYWLVGLYRHIGRLTYRL